jgi:hypothetical protein
MAAVASNTMGNRAQPGMSRKNGALLVVLSVINNAPCPR